LIQEAVGQAVDVHGHFQLQRPVVTIRNWKTGEIEETTTSDVPDLITTVGTIQTSPTVQEGAQIAFRLRRGPAFPGEPLFEWAINGEKGEIRLLSQDGTAIQAMHAENVRIEVHDHAAGKVEPVDWLWAPWQKDLPEINARNIGALYEAFAEGKERGYPTLKDALARHQQLDDIISSWKA
jgi:predicted dehydrogenase